MNTNDFEVTIEVSCLKDQVQESELKSYWQDNKYSLLSYIGQVIIVNQITSSFKLITLDYYYRFIKE